VGFSSQPFRLTWPDGARRRGHVPDYFARRADGTGVVIDVRADERIEPEDVEAFTVTEAACAEVGGISVLPRWPWSQSFAYCRT
jgi:hypothetical protein